MRKIIENFLKYLRLQGVSSNSLKYYKSDLVNFLTWAKERKINQELIQKYIEENRLTTSTSTLKRRMSTLRSFGNFKGIKKPIKSWQDNILTRFSNHPKLFKLLQKLFFSRPNWYRKYHLLPLSNYIHVAILILFCAIAGFAFYDQVFKNTKETSAFPTALTRPNRYLSFQGRLTSNLGNPITTATNVVFKLYDASSGGSQLWTSGTCSITPDSDGIFSTLLGSSCGSEITSDVFSENSSVWVGITVAVDAEATPRIQIATVAYALNAETLQGYPAGTGTSTIPYLNSSGELVIAAASPKIQSTSGTFAVEGVALTLTTPNASNGIITINPDGTGTLDLTFEGTAAGGGANGFVNATNANITGGALYGGTVASAATGYNFIDFQSGVSPTSKFSVNNAGNITTAGDIAIGGGNINPSAALTIGDNGDTLALDSSDWDISTTGDMTGIGAITANGLFTGTAGMTLTGAVINLNASSNFATNINTGTSNALVTIGGGSGTFSLQTTNIDISSAGAITNATGFNGLVITPNTGTVTTGVWNATDISLAAGGTNASLTADAGGIVYSGASALAISAAGTSGYCLKSGGTGTPTWGVCSTGSITGSGTDNYIPRWNGTTALENSVIYDDGTNIGIGDTTPSKMFVVGNGDLFQVDSSGNALAPTLALGTGTIARTDRLFDINDSTALTNAVTFTGTTQRTLTGTLTGSITDYGLYNVLTINATDDAFNHVTNGIYNQTSLSDGNTIDTMRGIYSAVYNNSATISPDPAAANTATTSAAIVGTTLNNAAGKVSAQYGGNFNSYTAVDGSTITNNYGVFGQSYELATQTTNGIATGYGGYFTSQDATTAYGLYAQGVQNTANTETFTNLYGINSDCTANGANITVTNCYGVLSSVKETAGTITNGYAGYFNIDNAGGTTTNAYGVYTDVTSNGTTNYGIYSNVSGATTNYAGIFMGGNVGIGDTTPLATLTVGNGDLFQVAGATGNITTAGDIAIGGGNINPSAALTIGDNGDTLALDSSDWDISTTGVMTGISGITTDGGYAQSGTTANTFTGTATFSNATYSALFTGGNVGIGTTGPTTQLHIGTNAETHTLGTSDVLISSDLELDGVLYLDGETITDATGATTILFASDPTAVNNYNLLSNGSWLIENPATGNPGIAALMVNQAKGGDIFTASASGTPKFVIANDGSVGIGTTAPSTALEVNGNISFPTGGDRRFFVNTATSHGYDLLVQAGDAAGTTGTIGGDLYLDAGDSDGIGGSKAGNILIGSLNNYNSGGNVGIKMSTATYPLDVTGDIRTSQCLRYNSGTLGTCTSDIQLKTNIQPLIFNNALAKVNGLSPKTYKFIKEPDRQYTGLIAQDVEMIAPELVVIGDDGYKQVKYGDIQWLTIEAIQEQQTQINSLTLNETGDVVLTGDSPDTYAVVTPAGITDRIGAFASATVAKLKSGIGSFRQIKTNLISPITNSDLIVDLQPDNDQTASKLVIKGENDEDVISFDASGDATISGTLYADDIESEKLKKIEELLHEVETNQSLLAESQNWETNTSTNSAELATYYELHTTNLFVTGQAAMSSLFVSDNFTTKNINSLTETLSIQSLASAPLEIMAGKIKIDTNGNAYFSGNVEVVGDLTINNLVVANSPTSGEPTSTSGEPKLTPEVLPGEITTNAIAGKAVLSAGQTEIKINNSKFKTDGLIYITPVSSTQNKVLYVKSKDVGSFTIGFNDPAIDTDVEFNWWIIELKNGNI